MASPSVPPASLIIEQAHPALHVDESPLRQLIQHVLTEEGRPLGSLNVILAGHEAVLALNREYLDHDYLTDVLSFPLGSENGVVEGEVYVDLDTAQERHAEFGASFEEEVQRYVLHGLLHLIGYGDATPEERAQIRALEDRYLQAL